MDFETAFTKLIDVEKGFQNDPKDKGNWTGGKVGVGVNKGTKYGISAARYPTLDIINLTLEQAKALYLRDFWGPAGCDAVPDKLKYNVFNTAVNSGPARAVMFLQQATGEVVDGILGPHTLQAVQAFDAERLSARFNGWRLDFLNDNPALWALYGRGWSQRIADELKEV